MNKSTFLPLLLVIGCSSTPPTPKLPEPTLTKSLRPCQSYELFAEAILGKGKKLEMARLLDIGLSKNDLDNSVTSYNSVCRKSEVFITSNPAKYGDDSKSVFVFKKGPANKAEISETDRYSEYNYEVVVRHLEYPLKKLNEYRSQDDIISFDQKHKFQLKYSFPDLSGELKTEAKKVRALHFEKFLFQSYKTVFDLASKLNYSLYLKEHLPLPLTFAEKKKVTDKINAILELVPEDKKAYTYADDETEKNSTLISNPFKENGLNCQESYEYGAAKDDVICEHALRNLVKSKSEREFLMGFILISVTEMEIQRSEDGKTLIFDIEVDVPGAMKSFRFDKISNHIER
jgi:hypothetical protein